MKKIKQYKVVEKIGSGGMGEVFKAFDTVLERHVAIKVMHRHLLNDAASDERFMREARMVAKSSHPNIVTIFEIGKTRNERFIVMEYVEGTPLDHVLQSKGMFRPQHAVNLCKQILSGLQHAHKLEILHRDIKAENILVTANDRVKILDFGIAKMASSKGLTVAGDLLGTIEYMPPEQLMGEPIDQRSDLYAAGVVLYQMLTGSVPFVSDSPAAVLYKQLNEDPIPPSYYNKDVDKLLDRVVLKALSKAREDRWESAEAFAAALQKRHGDSAIAGEAEPDATFEEDADIDTSTSRSSIFIGREQEMKLLVNRLGKLVSSGGQTVMIMGEAGVGKSTIANRFRDYVQSRGSFVLYGASLYQEGMDAYLPYVDALRTFFAHEIHRLPPEKLAEVKRIVREQTPLLYELTERFTTNVGQQSTPKPENPGESNLVEGIYSLLAVLSSINPVVLIIDDLQWADEASLRLFHYLSSHIKHNRICLIGISRTDRYDLRQQGKPGMLLNMLGRVRGNNNYTEVRLNRLERESCDLLVDRLLSPNLFTEEFYKSIFVETKGNPLFVTETLKQLQETECIYFKDDAWYNQEEGLSVIVPDRIEDIFVRRLSSLTEEEHEILQVAAVQGYKFDASILSKILELPKLKILRVCHHIEREIDIISSTEQGFQFEHPMLKDLLYNEMPSALRREYHSMIADELERCHETDVSHVVGDLGQHFRNGGKHKKAVPLLYEAGIRAFGLSAYREASIYFEDMLDSWQQTGEPKPQNVPLMDFYFKLGICYEESARFDQSLEAYGKYLQLSQNEQEFKHLSNALLRLGRVHGKLGNWDKALQNYQECLTIGKKHGLRNLLSRVYNNIGIIYFQQGDIPKALTHFEKTIGAVDSEHGEFDKAHALTNMGIIANLQGEHEKAMKNYRAALKIYATKQGRQQDEARIYHNIGMTLSDLNKWDEANEAFESCLKLADTVEDRPLLALTYLNMGKNHARRNHAAKAKTMTEKALKIFKRTDDTVNVAEAYHVLGLIAETGKNYHLAEKHILHSIKLNKELGHREGLAEALVSIGTLYRNQMKLKLALSNYEKALTEYHALGLDAKVAEVTEIIDHLNQEKQSAIRIVDVEPEQESINRTYASHIRHS